MAHCGVGLISTFPADVLADPARYAEAARIPPDADENERAAAASRRRDLAVAGFAVLRERVDGGDASALTEFHGAAARIASARASGWSDIVRARPLHSAERALEAARAVAAGESAHLADAAVHVAEPGAGPRAFGMCGRLRTYDVAD